MDNFHGEFKLNYIQTDTSHLHACVCACVRVCAHVCTCVCMFVCSPQGSVKRQEDRWRTGNEREQTVNIWRVCVCVCMCVFVVVMQDWKWRVSSKQRTIIHLHQLRAVYTRLRERRGSSRGQGCEHHLNEVPLRLQQRVRANVFPLATAGNDSSSRKVRTHLCPKMF